MNAPNPTSLALILSLPLSIACGQGTVDSAPVEPADETTRARLVAGERSFFALPADAEVAIDLDYQGVVMRHRLQPLDAYASLSAQPDGRVAVDYLNMSLGNISHGVMVDDFQGIVLKNARLETLKAHECHAIEWTSDNDRCAAAVGTQLRFTAVLAWEGEVEMGVTVDLDTGVDLEVYPGVGRGLRATLDQYDSAGLTEVKGAQDLRAGNLALHAKMVEAVPL